MMIIRFYLGFSVALANISHVTFSNKCYLIEIELKIGEGP